MRIFEFVDIIVILLMIVITFTDTQLIINVRNQVSFLITCVITSFLEEYSFVYKCQQTHFCLFTSDIQLFAPSFVIYTKHIVFLKNNEIWIHFDSSFLFGWMKIFILSGHVLPNFRTFIDTRSNSWVSMQYLKSFVFSNCMFSKAKLQEYKIHILQL